MDHVISPGHGLADHSGVANIALDHFNVWQVCQVGALARREIVEHAHAIAAPDERFNNVGPDEAGAACNQVNSHAVVLESDLVDCTFRLAL